MPPKKPVRRDINEIPVYTKPSTSSEALTPEAKSASVLNSQTAISALQNSKDSTSSRRPPSDQVKQTVNELSGKLSSRVKSWFQPEKPTDTLSQGINEKAEELINKERSRLTRELSVNLKKLLEDFKLELEEQEEIQRRFEACSTRINEALNNLIQTTKERAIPAFINSHGDSAIITTDEKILEFLNQHNFQEFLKKYRDYIAQLMRSLTLEYKFKREAQSIINNELTPLNEKLSSCLNNVKQSLNLEITAVHNPADSALILQAYKITKEKEVLQHTINKEFSDYVDKLEANFNQYRETVEKESIPDLVNSSMNDIVDSGFNQKMVSAFGEHTFQDFVKKSQENVDEFINAKMRHTAVEEIKQNAMVLNQKIAVKNSDYQKSNETTLTISHQKQKLEELSLFSRHIVKQTELEKEHKKQVEQKVSKHWEELEKVITENFNAEIAKRESAGPGNLKKQETLRVEIAAIMLPFSEDDKVSIFETLSQISIINDISEENNKKYSDKKNQLIVENLEALKEIAKVKLKHYFSKEQENTLDEKGLLALLPQDWLDTFNNSHQTEFEKYYSNHYIEELEEAVSDLEKLNAQIKNGIEQIKNIIEFKIIIKNSVEKYLKIYAQKDISQVLSNYTYLNYVPKIISTGASALADKAYKMLPNGLGYYRALMMMVNFGSPITKEQYNSLVSVAYNAMFITKKEFDSLTVLRDTYENERQLNAQECLHHLIDFFDPQEGYMPVSGSGELSLRTEIIKNILDSDTLKEYLELEEKAVDLSSPEKVNEASAMLLSKLNNLHQGFILPGSKSFSSPKFSAQ